MDVIIIAGGSGSGKSTISYSLVDKYPKVFEVLNLDDYQMLKTDPKIPMMLGKINWDHPNIIHWDNLINDVKLLKEGNSVTINSWAHRSNPNYFEHGNMIKRTMHPQKILIIEGYMSLINPNIRNFCKRSYYLQINETLQKDRRGKFIDPEYDINVLQPMHKKYIAPTMKFADVILDISTMTKESVYNTIEHDLEITFPGVLKHIS